MQSIPMSPQTKIFQVAKAQRGVMFCILGNIIGFFLWPVLLIVVPFQIYHVFKLAQGLGVGAPVVWALGMFIPLLSLIILVVLSSKATALLKEEGLKVGTMGADMNQVKKHTGIAG